LPNARGSHPPIEGPDTKKLAITSLLAAAIGVGASVLPANAADMSGGVPGGMKDLSRGAVPVPAPVPYEEHFRWYLRGDLGGSITARRPTLSESGLTYGAGDLVSPLVSSSFMTGDFSDLVGKPWGVGAGAYISRRFRMDLTGEYHGQSKGQLQGTYTYTTNLDAGGGMTNWGRPVGTTVTGTATDTLRTYSTVVMLNAYVDLMEGRKFTPYIGAGIGFAYNRWQREITIGDNRSACCTLDGTSGGNSGGVVTLAANATAGLTYALSNSTMLDFNYRLQYIQGYEITTPLSGVWLSTPATGTADSRLKIGDLLEHQFRAGMRVNLW
jgi:opacity protein-like surface antigen